MSALTLIAILIALAIFGWAIWFVIEFDPLRFQRRVRNGQTPARTSANKNKGDKQ